MSNPAIRLHFFVKNPEKEGSMKHDRSATLSEIVSQFENVLKSIPMAGGEYTAKDDCEWVSSNIELKPNEPATTLSCGDSYLEVMCRRGGNEGHIVDVVLFERHTNKHVSLVSAKWLSNPDDVWRITRHVSDAIYEGLFV